MEQARAAEAAAQAQNEKAIKGAREEQIQAAYEMWQKAQAGVTIAEKSYKRVKNLYEQGVMPAQKLDEVTAQRDAAIATEKAAKAQYTMAKNGAEREDKMAAEALVNRAKGAVAEVKQGGIFKLRRQKGNSRKSLSFLQDLRQSTARSRISLLFFIGFASFCYSSMMQMTFGMKELASAMFRSRRWLRSFRRVRRGGQGL